MTEDTLLQRLGGNEIAARLARNETVARVAAWDGLTLPRPPAGLRDPGFANPDNLRRLGVTQPPDPAVTPRLARSWDATILPGLRFIPCSPAKDLEVLTAFRMVMGGEAGGSLSGATGAIAGRWGTSRNWSGAVIAARDGGRFSEVHGHWTVPHAAPPPGADLGTPPPGGVWKQSVWIGLDGYRLCSRSLPQVGTASLYDPALHGQPDPDDPAAIYAGEHYLWVQWWVRLKMYGECRIKGFKVRAGDRIRAILQEQPNGNVLFNVTNLGNAATNPAPLAVRVDWANGVFSGDNGLAGGLVQEGRPELARGDAPVEGRHAVWCVERPGVMPANAKLSQAEADPSLLESYRIPAFGGAVFDLAVAKMTMPDGSAVERDLTAARRLRMIETERGAAPSVAFATTPDEPPPTGFILPFDRDGIAVTQV